jgi:hypothetical protein
VFYTQGNILCLFIRIKQNKDSSNISLSFSNKISCFNIYIKKKMTDFRQKNLRFFLLTYPASACLKRFHLTTIFSLPSKANREFEKNLYMAKVFAV